MSVIYRLLSKKQSLHSYFSISFFVMTMQTIMALMDARNFVNIISHSKISS